MLLYIFTFVQYQFISGIKQRLALTNPKNKNREKKASRWPQGSQTQRRGKRWEIERKARASQGDGQKKWMSSTLAREWNISYKSSASLVPTSPNPALAVPSKWTNNKMSWECGEKKGATSVRPESERPWTRDEPNTEHAHRHTRTQWHILRACTSELNIVWYWTSYLQAIRKGGGVERRAGHRMMMMMATTRTTTATMVDSDYRVVCPAPALAIYAMSVLCCGNRNNCTQRLGAHNARQMVEERQI